MMLVTGIANANPCPAMRDKASQLEAMHERTPRGSSTWTASSVKNLFGQGKKLQAGYGMTQQPELIPFGAGS